MTQWAKFWLRDGGPVSQCCRSQTTRYMCTGGNCCLLSVGTAEILAKVGFVCNAEVVATETYRLIIIDDKIHDNGNNWYHPINVNYIAPLGGNNFLLQGAQKQRFNAWSGRIQIVPGMCSLCSKGRLLDPPQKGLILNNSSAIERNHANSLFNGAWMSKADNKALRGRLGDALLTSHTIATALHPMRWSQWRTSRI